jgi:hypothetical protein
MADNYKINFEGRTYKYNPFFDFLSNDELAALGVNTDTIPPNRTPGSTMNVVPKDVGYKIYKETLERYNAIPKTDADLNNLIPGKNYFTENLGTKTRDGDYWGLQIQEECFDRAFEGPDDGKRYAIFNKGIVIFPPTNGRLGFESRRVPLYPNEKIRIKEAVDTTAKDAAIAELKQVIDELKYTPSESNISFVGEKVREAEQRFNDRNAGGKTKRKAKKARKSRKARKSKK